MRKYLLGFLLLIPLAVAACGTNATAAGGGASGAGGGQPPAAGGATVSMNAVNFLPNNGAVTIRAGQTVTFVDPSAGGLHYLLTGKNGSLTKEAGAPAVLSTPTGMPINAGQTLPVTFPTAGTFMVTCTIHPYMEATIVVTP